MGRPEEPLERDGSPIREFAFWLRDLRRQSGLTYHTLASTAHYAPSTMQAAAAGHRLPTLKVTLSFVRACGGNVDQWRTYWRDVKRALDTDAPAAGDRPGVVPPWIAPGRPDEAGPEPADGVELSGPPAPAAASNGAASDEQAAPDGWYVESFTAMLRMYKPTPEAQEHRVIVAVRPGVQALATSISVPRHRDDEAPEHEIEAELEYGGHLELREQEGESYFRHYIRLPRTLSVGEHHEYQILLKVPPGQQMVPHYAYVPFCRSDRFELRARFDPRRLPAEIWLLSGAATAVIYDRRAGQPLLIPDQYGDVHAEFSNLRIGRAYGICWRDQPRQE
jgi:hypothetical protein